MTWPITPVATGDLVTAGQLNQLPIALAEASGADDIYDFTNIPPYWTHLSIECALQGDSGSSMDDLYIRFNGDTGNNYINQYLRAVDATVTADGLNSMPRILGGGVPGVSAGSFSANILWIPNYAVAQKHSLVATAHGAFGNSADNNQRLSLAGGAWMPSTPAALTRIELFLSAGQIVAGSVATMYGWGLV